MTHHRIFLSSFRSAVFLLLAIACTSPQNKVAIRKAVKIVVETNHKSEEQASLPDPEINILPGTFVIKSYIDAENHLLKEEKWSADGQLEWREEFFYDEAGNNIERLKYHRDSLIERIVQKFDASSRLTSAEEYGPKEKLLRKKSAAYDRSGNGMVITDTNIQGEFVKSVESVYDSSNRLIETRYFIQPPGDHTDETSVPGLNSWLQRITYKYDPKNNLIQTMEVNSSLVMKSSASFTYDSLNNLTSSIIQSSERSRAQHTQYEYTYDNNGQWTKRKTFLNNHLMSVTIQRIISLSPESKETNQ